MVSILLTILKTLKWKCLGWMPDYIKGRRNSSVDKNNIFGDATDIIFLIVDHFEPSRRDGVKGEENVEKWCKKYSELAAQYRDSDGVHPQHSWFYRYDYPNINCLNTLSKYVFKGFGEIDFHLHHGNDTSESFNNTIEEGVVWFNLAGAMIDRNDITKTNFAYIAGNWALDNGRNDDRYSGVNNELEILRDRGCYADFTFPALAVSSQPKKVNSIYYAVDDPRPKSYNTGVDLKVGKKAAGDLMIFEGPLYISWSNAYIDDASFEVTTPFIKERLAYWLKADVHVKGRPEWKFIKLHTHGMQNRDIFLSDALTNMFQTLEQDVIQTGKRRLHYVNAREAYNMAKAAEAGEVGDAGDYRDYLLQQPLNKTFYCNRAYRARTLSKYEISIEIEENNNDVVIELNDSSLKKLSAKKLTTFKIVEKDGVIVSMDIDGEGDCELNLQDNMLKGYGENPLISLPFHYALD